MRRRTWMGLCVAAVVVVGGGLAALDALAVVDDLATARAATTRARAALQAENLELAQLQFAEARTAAARVPARVDGPVWALVELLPGVGDTPELARAASDLVVASADLAEAGLPLLAGLLEGEVLAELVGTGGVDLEALASVREQVRSLPGEPLREASARLEAVDPNRVPAALRDDREVALDEAKGLVETFDRGLLALDAMGELFGAEGERTYLVAAQNPAELRGTGGLIGFFTEMVVVDGDVSLREGLSFDIDEDLAQRTRLESPRDLPPAVPRPPEFAERYDHVAGGQFFGSVNLDPDLPTVGPVLLALYAQETGRELDGVILLDPVALGAIVHATGRPLTLPGGLDTAGLPTTVPGRDLARLVMIDGYDAFGGGGPGKKAFDRAMIGAALERLLVDEWEGAPVAQALRQQIGARRLQVHSVSAETQAALELLGVAGGLPAADDRDVLALTANNAAPDKADVHVEHHISGDITLAAAGPDELRRSARIEVAVDNPLAPGDHDDYITGSSRSVPFGSGPPERIQDALVRTWLSVWTLPTSRLLSPRDEVSGDPLRVDDIHGLRVVDFFLDTPSRQRTSFAVGYEGLVPARSDYQGLVYELELWRQGKAIPDHWDLRITPPEGWTLADATVVGGGSAVGAGFGDPDAEPLAATVEDGVVVVRGAATQDATVRVRLIP